MLKIRLLTRYMALFKLKIGYKIIIILKPEAKCLAARTEVKLAQAEETKEGIELKVVVLIITDKVSD